MLGKYERIRNLYKLFIDRSFLKEGLLFITVCIAAMGS